MIEMKIDASEFIKDLEEIPSNIIQTVSSDQERILTTIKDITTPYVPLESGALRESPIIREKKATDTSLLLEVEYSAKNKRTGYDYAEIQHENLFYHHEYGQAKYLEVGFGASEAEVLKIIKEDVNKCLNRSK